MDNKVLAGFILAIFAISSVCSLHYYDDVGKKLLTKNESQDKELEDISTTCLRKSKVNPALLHEVELFKFPEDMALKCYYKCYFQAYGTLQENGTFTLDVLNEQMTPNQYKAAIYCKDQVKSEHLCERAWEIYTCYLKKINDFK